MQNKCRNLKIKRGILLAACLISFWAAPTTPVAEAKFKNASSPQCTSCHTTVSLTVQLFSDSGATTPLADPVIVNTGSTLNFYAKVSGEPPGNYIGAGVKYPAGVNPLGSQVNKQDPNTWTTYTPTGLRLANNAEYSWNSKNINITKDATTTDRDVFDSDNNGYEIFPGTLNIPSTATPGSYLFTIYGGGTDSRGGSVSLTVDVQDLTAPAQITDLSVNYYDPNIRLDWTTPTPPDNSGSISYYKVYRHTDPISNANLASTTLVQSIAGTAGGTINQWDDPDSATLLNNVVYYYAVLATDANNNASPVSTGPKVSATKSTSNIPTSTMVHPIEGSSETGTFELTARATDDVGVTSVDFHISTTTDFSSYTTVSGATLSSGKTTDGFWTVNWNSTGINGTRYIRARAGDGTNYGTSGYYTVFVDNTSPSPVSMTAPANLSTLQNVITLQASTQDNFTVDRVIFQVSTDSSFNAGVSEYVGATLTSGTTTNGTWSRDFSTNIISNGIQYIRGAIYDKANNVSYTTAFQYNVNNSPDAVPHGNYGVSTGACAACHNTHGSESKYLLIPQRVNDVCFNCHDGTSAQKAKSFPSTYEHLWDAKDVYCNDCHNPHQNRTTEPIYLLLDTYDSGTTTGAPADYNLCFNCHKNPYNNTGGYVQATADIYQFYSKLSNAGAGTKGLDKGHFVQNNRYTFPDNTAVPIGFQLRCTDCHDQHGSTNKFFLKTKLGDNPNTITVNSPGTTLTETEERTFCTACHNGTTRLYNAEDALPIIWDDYKSTGHTDASKRCTSCHGGEGTETEKIMRGSHAPGAGESSGGQECLACHNVIQDAMEISITTTFHHVVDYVSFQADYSLTNSCLQCHVDHDKFRPGISVSNKRGANLRTKYEALNSASATNTDFINDAVGGLCLSCHTSSKTKAYDPTKSTQAIPGPSDYNASKHNYEVYSTFSDTVPADNTTKFKANCTKCHNDYLANSIPYDYQTSSNPFVFGVHASSIRSILGKLGVVSPTQPLEEDLCYRCHTGATNSDYFKQTDATQGSAMTPKSQSIMNVFQRGYKHPVTLTRGIHQSVEGASPGWTKAAAAGGDRHVECQDCHNTHAARTGTSRDGSTFGTNGTRDGKNYVDDIMAGSLYDTWGVSVSTTYTARGTANAGDKVTYSRTTSPKAQWQLCFKCHSDYGWDDGDTSTGAVMKGLTGAKAEVPNTTFPRNTVDTNTGTGDQPDIGLQFNPGNYAFHPLFEVGLNQPASGLNANWASSSGRRAAASTYKGGDGSATYPYNSAIVPAALDNTFVDGWGTKSLVTCTDCHASSDDQPDGPHGSTQRWVLRKAEARTVTSAGAGTINLNTGFTDSRQINNFCLNCHRSDVYGKGTGAEIPTYQNLSRFNHGFKTGTGTPDKICMVSGNMVLGTALESPNCLGCHGGREPGGIHGSIMGVAGGGGGAGVSPQGKRFTNGANWTSHTLGQGGASVACWTTATPDNVAACTKGHGGQSQSPNYDY